MIRVGLTGSIGMGKSTVLSMFRDLGAAIWAADTAVHNMYDKGGAAVDQVAKAFPGTVKDGAVDRAALAGAALKDAESIKKLEGIVHPLVTESRRAFSAKAKSDGVKMAVADIPLLFETNVEDAFDVIVVVSASPEVQRKRVLARPGMSQEKLNALLSRQLPDAQKRKRADFVIDTSGSIEETGQSVKEAYKEIIARHG